MRNDRHVQICKGRQQMTTMPLKRTAALIIIMSFPLLGTYVSGGYQLPLSFL